jgi:hypothetical protein
MGKSMHIILAGAALMTLLAGNTLVSYASTARAGNSHLSMNEVEHDGVPESGKPHSDLNEGEHNRVAGVSKNDSDATEIEHDGVPELGGFHSDVSEGEEDSGHHPVHVSKH